MADLPAGLRLGDRFSILGVLGRGGMATVYLAEDELRGDRVALKVVHHHLLDDPSMRLRLQREVQAAQHVRHPRAVVAYDLHELDGVVALSMPFAKGEPLGERVADTGPLAAEAVRQVGVEVGEVLAEAHRRGVVHRDVTPSNVLVDAEHGASLTDFGLARLVERGTRHSTQMMGTVGYCAPEVLDGVRADPRSDLYGLGAVLYLAITGREPFAGGAPMAVLSKQLQGELTPVRELAPECPEDLALTIEALLRPAPSERPSSAAEVVAALGERQASGGSVSAPSTALEATSLPSGNWSVVVKERLEDEGRRRRLRAQHGKAPAKFGDQVAQAVEQGIRSFLGMGEATSPEDFLRLSVASHAGLPPEALSASPSLAEKRFRLVDGVDRETAQVLASGAREAGFVARVHQSAGGSALWDYWPASIAIAWAAVFPALMMLGAPSWTVFVFVAFTIAMPFVGGARSAQRRRDDLPLAYGADLRHHLAEGFVAEDAGDAEQSAASLTRGEELAEGARAALSALDVAVEKADLAAPAEANLRRHALDLLRHVETLSSRVDALDTELGRESSTDIAWAVDRLRRLTTMEAAGEVVDAGEKARLQEAIEAHRAAIEAESVLESELASAVAQLLEITATATRARRELAAETRRPAAVSDRLDGLVADMRAAAAARDEAAVDKGADARKRQAAIRARLKG